VIVLESHPAQVAEQAVSVLHVIFFERWDRGAVGEEDVDAAVSVVNRRPPTPPGMVSMSCFSGVALYFETKSSRRSQLRCGTGSARSADPGAPGPR